ncbi:unnamed protein product [Vitrella brassicaformis CCMP3155]|uniref:Uncharacterized protein n=1 Tax=Vitrella brassicaformis (strain CCMP3155) TaxID=1169540 RepID=A0A0G4GKG4_VITBC|nr:unnamed protein product [Vitrella brassicaformis CCMP3155]|eukprot:CEM30508.1 unnamed protein product [Vitrella brassicaformis CCMP3155]
MHSRVPADAEGDKRRESPSGGSVAAAAAPAQPKVDEQNRPVTLKTTWRQFLVFVRAYCLTEPTHSLALLGVQGKKCEYLYEGVCSDFSPDCMIPMEEDFDTDGVAASGQAQPPPQQTPEAPPSGLGVGQMKECQPHLQATLRLKRLLSSSYEHKHGHGGTRAADSSIAGALSMALCHIQRRKKEHPSAEPRVLILEVSCVDGLAFQFVPLMSAAFAGQKMNVMIDVCALGTKTSMALQQAALMTRGQYMQFSHPNSNLLLPFLLFHFLPNADLREDVLFPAQASQSATTFGATCFCCGKPVELALVCSSCLAIYCHDIGAVCKMCSAQFRPLPANKRQLCHLLYRPPASKAQDDQKVGVAP